MDLKPLIEEFYENVAEIAMSKYVAVRSEVLRPILRRLLGSDREAFDAMMWLVGWVQFKSQGCAWREGEIARLIDRRINGGE